MTERRTTRRQPRLARDLRRQTTFPEQVLWNMLRVHRLGGHPFRRQYPIGHYIVDYCSVRRKLVVELDGMSHVGTGEADERRSAWLASQGWRVIRFTNDQVLEDRFLVAEAILDEIEGRRVAGPPSQPPPGGRGEEELQP